MSRYPRLSAIMLLFALGYVLPAWAGQHPVPLEKGIKEDKCLECHEDKTKGKTVHPAVGMGCFSCHLVRGEGEAARVTLKNGRPATLCFSCHADKQQNASKGRIHPPTQSDCLKCHDPHVSDNEKLLLKPVSGGKSENLCLSCHNEGENVPKGGSRHPALDMGCSTCHMTHKTGERGKQEFDFHLTKSTPALCLDCHDVKDKKLAEAHQNQPFETANCVSCHNPHDSKSPKLMQSFLHQPFEGKMCESCHQPAKDGKVVLTQADSRAVCGTCHEEEVKKIDSAKVPHPGAQGECVACHDPHGGKSPRFMKPDPVGACLACHAEQAEMLTSKRYLHDPAFNQRCSICHEAHGGTRPALLKDDVDTLCLGCHAPDAKALKAEDGNSESILGKSIVLPVGYVAKASHIELARNMTGHPVPAHPISGKDPRDESKKITCVSCHNPHAGNTKRMIVAEESTEPRALCKQCHKEQ